MLLFNRKKTLKIKAVVGPEYCYVDAYAPITLGADLKGNGELSKEGIVIPMWSDLAIKWDDEKIKWQFSDRNSKLSLHGEDQSPGFLSDYIHLKMHCPWMLETSVPMLAIHASSYLSTPAPYIVPYGVIPPIDNKISTNIFLFLKKNGKENKLMIKHGTPMLQLIPLYDGPFKLTKAVISGEEYQLFAGNVGALTAFNKRGLQLLHKEKINKK